MPNKIKVARKNTPKRKAKSSRGYNLLSKNTHRVSAIIFVLIFASIGSFMLFFSKAETPPSQLGVYTGPADVAGHDTFSQWLGSSVSYSVQFVDHRKGWETDFNPNWLLDPMSAWVKADPNRRLSLSVPMLENSDSGQAGLLKGNSGSFDIYFRNLAQNMVDKDLGNSVIRLGWESNGNWYPWAASNDPTTWKSYYRRIVGIMKSVPGQNFAFEWNRSNGTYVSFDDHYPGDDVVDIISVDAYDIKWMDSTSTPEERWNFTLNQNNGLNAFAAFANAHGKPMAVTEWGLWGKGTDQGGGGDNPYYIDRMADWFAANNVVYHSYFNVLGETDFRLETYPNSQARYKARFGPSSDVSPPTQPANLTSPSQTVNTVNLSWLPSTDNVGVTSYDVYRNNAKITTVATNNYSDTGLTAGTVYSYYVIARDAAGNASPSSNNISVATQSTPPPPATDIISPVVVIASPADNSTTGRGTRIKASATDNVAVTKMQVYIDGNLEATSASDSISYRWNSRKVAQGGHSITIKAYDEVGNVGQKNLTVFK